MVSQLDHPKFGGHVFDFAPEGGSLTVKHPKAKVTTLKNLGLPTFLCNAAWIFEPTSESRRFSESDPEDVVKPDAGIS